NEADATVFQQHEVAGMDVGMEEVATYQTGKPGVERIDERLRRVVRVALEHLYVGERHAEEALHGQHLGAGQFEPGTWRHGAGVAGAFKKFVEFNQVLGFQQEVALLQHAGLQLVDDAGNGRARQARRQAFGNAGGEIKKVEV